MIDRDRSDTVDCKCSTLYFWYNVAQKIQLNDSLVPERSKNAKIQ